MTNTQTRTIALHTLGCKLNQTETATIGRQFVRDGYRVVPFGTPADVVVLNTCSVTEKADKECRQLVRRIRRTSPDAFVAVVGCYAQLRPDEIASLPGVDLVAGTTEKFDLLRHVSPSRSIRPVPILRSEPSTMEIAVSSHSEGVDRTRAFLKVQDGCDYTCSFCTIPLARGESRSVPISTVLREAIHLSEAGFREIVLTGVNTGDYGKNEDGSLLSLLQQMVSVDGIDRIRISSVEPNLLSDELLDFWISHEKLCNHWHIPLQSGSDETLRGMRRRYATDWYASRIARIHESRPLAGIGADVIVGFPGETDDHFDQTMEFIKDLPISYLHVFSYSERPWTDAKARHDQIDPRMKAERSRRLRELGERKKRTFHEQFVGSTVTVLIEDVDEDGNPSGLSEEYIRVKVPGVNISTNELVPVLITHANAEWCEGNPVDLSQNFREATHAVA